MKKNALLIPNSPEYFPGMLAIFLYDLAYVHNNSPDLAPAQSSPKLASSAADTSASLNYSLQQINPQS